VEILIIASIAIIYALIRAKHDSYLFNGKWKTWAFIEGTFLAILASLASWAIFDTTITQTLLISPIFGLIFWIVFDSACGWHRVRELLYFGSNGWDAKMERMFIRPINYLIAKTIWLIITIGAFTEF